MILVLQAVVSCSYSAAAAYASLLFSRTASVYVYRGMYVPEKSHMCIYLVWWYDSHLPVQPTQSLMYRVSVLWHSPTIYYDSRVCCIIWTCHKLSRFVLFLSPGNRLGLFKTYIRFSKTCFLSSTTHSTPSPSIPRNPKVGFLSKCFCRSRQYAGASKHDFKHYETDVFSFT